MAAKNKLFMAFRLLSISAKLDLMWLLRDAKYALTIIFCDAIANLSTISSVFLIAVRFDGIGGMSADEVLFMMSYSSMSIGLFYMFSGGNNAHISRIIGRGQLEHLFIQPVPLGTGLLTMGFLPFTGSMNFIVGVIMTAISVNRLQLKLDAWWFVMLIGYCLISITIIVARSYLVSSAAFYAPVAAEEISNTIIDETWFLSTFPLSGMPKAIQFTLLTIMPDGLLAWYPALCLLGKPPLGMTEYYPLAFAILLSIIAKFVFQKGMRYYVQKGSNRYVPYGFRR